MKNFHSESVDTLVKGLLKLETEEECFAFLEDVCTIKELQDMLQRLEVAKLLGQGKNYQEISHHGRVLHQDYIYLQFW